MASKDGWVGNSLSKKSIREHITPHKISVVILIQEYCNVKSEAIRQAKNKPEENLTESEIEMMLHELNEPPEKEQTPMQDSLSLLKKSFGVRIREIRSEVQAIRQAKKSEDNFMESKVEMMNPQYRRDFCMLILHLIQCPDMDFCELLNLLQHPKYKLPPTLVSNFLREINGFTSKEVGSFMDIILNLGQLLIDTVNLTPMVNKSSPIGVYLRRVMLFFDKLNFSRTVSLYRGFKNYVAQGRESLHAKGRGLKPLSPEPPLATPGQPPVEVPPESIGPDQSAASSSVMDSVNMDLSSVVEEMPSAISPQGLLDPVAVHALEDMKCDEESVAESVPPLWSRRQAELFIARQTAWLQNNESLALPPTQLQDVIRQVLKANPEHFEAHYLSYLNCLRVKELTGAIDSLYHFFDRSATNSQDKEAKGYRYAALNLAILHAQYGHKSEALAALKEAIFLSHEVNDNVCLQHAQAWLYKLTDENKEILMERSISKCSDLSLNYLTSLGLQSFAQFAGTTGGKPALVFEVLMRSDVLNCQFSMMDLMAHSFCHKAALWTLYGKADMASLSSQLLLHLDTTDSNQGLNSYNGETTCQAICNIALRLTELGEYELSMLVIEHAKKRFSNSSVWQLSEQVLYFTRSMYRGEWQAAHSAVRQLATLNKWEALLRKGELLLAQGNSAGALAAVTTVLDGGPSLCPSVRVRALLLAARGSHAAAVSILTAALSIANYHYLDYLTALVAMQLAHVQLQMNLPNQALKLMDQSLLVVLSHGGYYDQASALLLFVQCKVASVATAESELRSEVIADAIRLLNKVKENFHHMEAFIKVKEAVYIQSLLANELGCVSERDKFAYEFRQLDEEFPTTLQI